MNDLKEIKNVAIAKENDKSRSVFKTIAPYAMGLMITALAGANAKVNAQVPEVFVSANSEQTTTNEFRTTTNKMGFDLDFTANYNCQSSNPNLSYSYSKKIKSVDLESVGDIIVTNVVEPGIERTMKLGDSVDIQNYNLMVMGINNDSEGKKIWIDVYDTANDIDYGSYEIKNNEKKEFRIGNLTFTISASDIDIASSYEYSSAKVKISAKTETSAKREYNLDPKISEEMHEISARIYSLEIGNESVIRFSPSVRYVKRNEDYYELSGNKISKKSDIFVPGASVAWNSAIINSKIGWDLEKFDSRLKLNKWGIELTLDYYKEMLKKMFKWREEGKSAEVLLDLGLWNGGFIMIGGFANSKTYKFSMNNNGADSNDSNIKSATKSELYGGVLKIGKDWLFLELKCSASDKLNYQAEIKSKL